MNNTMNMNNTIMNRTNNTNMINFDDVPIRPVNQDFNKILEDKLKEESLE